MSITNLDHLFKLYNIKDCLVDTSGKKFLKSKFQHFEFALSYINESKYTKKDLTMLVSTQYSKNEKDEKQLKDKYDLIIVNDADMFQNLFHKAVFIYIFDKTTCNLLDPFYSKLSSFGEGVLYRNEYHSLTFPNHHLSVYEQTFIRDKPFRFLKKIIQLSEKDFDLKVIIEIGSSRKPLDHHIDEINPVCCNDSHSTFFFTRINNTIVHTCDINPMCKIVIQRANQDGLIEFGTNTRLKIHIKDGIEFLQEYSNKNKNPTIDFLFLDAWDVGTHQYADNHLKAYQTIKNKLSSKCIISIDDTDIANNGKGKYLIPELLNDDFIIIYKARHTMFYRNN